MIGTFLTSDQNGILWLSVPVNQMGTTQGGASHMLGSMTINVNDLLRRIVREELDASRKGRENA